MWVRVRRVVISIALLIGLPMLGLNAGPRILSAWRDADVRNWRSLGTPPLMPSAMVSADLDSVAVRTVGGSFFECDHMAEHGTTLAGGE